MSESPALIVVDTSVAVKWYVTEDFRKESLVVFEAMSEGEIQGVAPSIIQPEFWNTLWQKRRRGELSSEEARAIWMDFNEDPISIYSLEDLMPRAVEIAESGVIIYDALFVALAEALEAVVVTADDRLLRDLRKTDLATLARHVVGAVG